MKENIRKLTTQLRVALLGATLVVAGSTLAFSSATKSDEAKAEELRLVVNETPVKREGNVTTSFAPVVKKVAPSVVKVFTSSKVKTLPIEDSPFSNDPFFRRFFGDGLDRDRSSRGFRAPRQHGLGSGVIVTADGYILTNNHVVDSADEVKVAVADGQEYTAKVIGKDPKTDIAVLKIDAKNLSYAELADSDKIEVGDLVLAVGNPFGIGQTVTMGIVSATGRGFINNDMYEDFIQTDAAINPGNSGGALVDADGRLIGINTAILSRTGGNQGIGFAVPVNLARSVLENIVEHGRVVRGFLGVGIQDVTPQLAKTFDLERADGALVAEVTPGSPADKAGLQSGDVIVEFNGKTIDSSRHLKLQVGAIAPGTKATIKLLREGKEKDFTVTLKEVPQDAAIARNDGSESEADDSLDGVTVGDLDPAMARQFNLPRSLQGAVVMDVEQDSAAFEAGLRAGDVIQEINRRPVRNAEDAVELTKNTKDKSVLLRVWSRGGSRYIVVDESKVG